MGARRVMDEYRHRGGRPIVKMRYTRGGEGGRGRKAGIPDKLIDAFPLFGAIFTVHLCTLLLFEELCSKLQAVMRPRLWVRDAIRLTCCCRTCTLLLLVVPVDLVFSGAAWPKDETLQQGGGIAIVPGNDATAGGLAG